jgi:hypothetical protein
MEVGLLVACFRSEQIGPGLDADGAVCIPSWRAEEVLLAAEARYERETRLREQLMAGATSYDLHGLRVYVEMNRRTQNAC